MDTKSWSFPIQQYKRLIQKLKTKKDFSIEKDLSEKEIINIQVVIIDQDDFFINVQFPKNDVLKRILYNLKGRWNSGKFSWALPQKQTEEF